MLKHIKSTYFYKIIFSHISMNRKLRFEGEYLNNEKNGNGKEYDFNDN